MSLLFTRVTPALLAIAGSAAVLVAAGPEPIDHAINARIRAEARDRSQIMQTLHVLTDVYGPRLTGSPNHKAAAEWTIAEMKRWGFDTGRLEEWDFGHPGWLNERLTAHVTSPVKDALVAEALAWTNGTNGPVKAAVVHLILPDAPHAGRAHHLPRRQGRRRGQPHRDGRGRHAGARHDHEDAAPARRRRPRRDVRPDQPARAAVPRWPHRGGSGARSAGARARPPLRTADRRAGRRLPRGQQGARARQRRRPGPRPDPRLQQPSFDGAKAVPTIIAAQRGLRPPGPPPRRWRARHRSRSTSSTARTPRAGPRYNAIAEIPGTDKADEVVMLGGHLDSWHAATGATDNAIGAAVMMEAVRILKAIGVKPRRTIRVALWGGEEQGLLGSQAYVAKHFGTAEAPMPEYREVRRLPERRLAAPAACAAPRCSARPRPRAILREIVAPFEDLGMVGATATNSRRTGGTDSTSFNAAGLPGIGLAQDPIEYGPHTWHTNLDTYERIDRSRREEERAHRDRLDASTTSPCATRCCRASRRTRCPPPRRHRLRRRRRPRRRHGHPPIVEDTCGAGLGQPALPSSTLTPRSGRAGTRPCLFDNGTPR